MLLRCPRRCLSSVASWCQGRTGPLRLDSPMPTARWPSHQPPPSCLHPHSDSARVTLLRCPRTCLSSIASSPSGRCAAPPMPDPNRKVLSTAHSIGPPYGRATAPIARAMASRSNSLLVIAASSPFQMNPHGVLPWPLDTGWRPVSPSSSRLAIEQQTPGWRKPNHQPRWPIGGLLLQQGGLPGPPTRSPSPRIHRRPGGLPLTAQIIINSLRKTTNVVQFGGFPFDLAYSSRISTRCGGAF